MYRRQLPLASSCSSSPPAVVRALGQYREYTVARAGLNGQRSETSRTGTGDWTDRQMYLFSEETLLLIVALACLIIGVCLATFAVVFARRLRESLRRLHQQLMLFRQPFSSDDHAVALQRQINRIQATLQNELTRLNFAVGTPTDPSEIFITDIDSYERLDQNWGSIRDTSGRQLSPSTIDGDRQRTAVIVVLGQSNAANHGSGRYIAKHRVDNFNIYDGKCYHAADPLLGASADGGNFATRLGDKLIEAGLFDRVILAPIAMGGTTVEQWAGEGMFNRRIVVLIRRLFDSGLTIDFIIWQQGEGNTGAGDIGGRQYRKNLWEVVDTFRKFKVSAPFFVALATFCGGPHNNAENIRAGQKSAVNAKAGVFLGADTDLIGIEHRWDGCHFSETGLEMAASSWLQIIGDFQSAAGLHRHAQLKSATFEARANCSANVSGPGLRRQTILSCLASAFAVENAYRRACGPIAVMNKLQMVEVPPSKVASFLFADELVEGSSIRSEAEMVIASEYLNHQFRPRAALDDLYRLLRPGGRLLYTQRLGDQGYLSLTPKWFLDYFIAADCRDCRVYVLWSPDKNPSVATFDYSYMLKYAHPVYNPMWDNITHGDAMLLVAEKGSGSGLRTPSQDIYRSGGEWARVAEVLRRLAASNRPCHVTGPSPAILPPGFRSVET